MMVEDPYARNSYITATTVDAMRFSGRFLNMRVSLGACEYNRAKQKGLKLVYFHGMVSKGRLDTATPAAVTPAMTPAATEATIVRVAPVVAAVIGIVASVVPTIHRIAVAIATPATPAATPTTMAPTTVAPTAVAVCQSVAEHGHEKSHHEQNKERCAHISTMRGNRTVCRRG